MGCCESVEESSYMDGTRTTYEWLEAEGAVLVTTYDAYSDGEPRRERRRHGGRRPLRNG